MVLVLDHEVVKECGETHSSSDKRPVAQRWAYHKKGNELIKMLVHIRLPSNQP